MSLGRRMEEGLPDDIRHHIELETRDNIERGMSPAEARAAALRRFGNVTRALEDTHAVWHWMWLERILQDLRYALRSLRANPGFAAVAILTLALGIGMNSALFSVVNAVLIRPLAYPHPERLVWISNYNTAFRAEIVAADDYFDWRAQARSFDGMAEYQYGDMTIAYGDTAEQSFVAEVSDDFWTIAGVQPALGRLFTPGERDTILLTHALFTRRFGGDPSIVGKTVLVGGRPRTIAGVLPRGFQFLLPMPQRANADPRDVDAYMPDDVRPATLPSNRGRAIVNVIARLKPGIPIEQARSEIETIQARIAATNPLISYGRLELRVTPLQERLVGSARQALLILSGAVTFVLLIACANIASLLLARTTARRHEVAIRAAVGAGRRRMIAQFLTEGFVLALAGGAAGLMVARATLAVLLRIQAAAVPRLAGAAIDTRVLLFTAALSLAAGILFGLGPAISLSRTSLQSVLKNSPSASSGASGLRLRTVLVAAELAIALVLLIGAGLMIKSLWRMSARPPGFHPESILTMKVSLTGAGYRDRDRQLAYFEEMLRRLETAPGVDSAGIVFSPMRGVVEIEGAKPLPIGLPSRAVFYSTSPGYFRAMSIQLQQGRWITVQEPEPVVMVNAAFARSILSGKNPFGTRVRFPSLGSKPVYASIAGVVSDVKYSKLDAEPGPEVYFPYRQSFFVGANDVVVRAAGDPRAIEPAVRKLISTIDPSQPVFAVKTLEQALAGSIAPRRFNLFLLEVFAATALVLAIVGIYGVMSYAVSQRTREIGVRMALGARRTEVVSMVVRQGVVVAITGIVAGIAAAYPLTKLITTLLYDVKPDDPATFAAVATILGIAAILACTAPAVRAARVDPIVALRYE